MFFVGMSMDDQEGLPDYWGIETYRGKTQLCAHIFFNQEGLPDYWGIETIVVQPSLYMNFRESGRITRLLGY